MTLDVKAEQQADIGPFVARLSDRLTLDECGLWCVQGEKHVSYPEEIRSDYATIEPFSYWFNHRNRCIISVARRYPPKGILLDIGGGNGIVSLAFQQAGMPSIVVEPGASGAQIARSRGVPVIRSDFSSIGIADETIQAAGLFDVLEHVQDHFSFLEEIRKALVRRSLLYLTVPALPYLWSFEDRFVGHYRRYTMPSVWRILSQTGFRVRYATYFFRPLVLPIFFFRSVPSLFGLLANRKKEVARSHTLPSNFIGGWLARSLEKEEAMIGEGACIPLGSSILVVAERT